MNIGVVNESTLILRDDAIAMVAACHIQMNRDVAPAWDGEPAVVQLFDSEDAVPQATYLIAILDDPDQAGCLGYHSESPTGRKYGKVFVRPSMEAGGTALTGIYGVSTVLSHEVIEAWVDPRINVWVDGPQRPEGCCYALEACDPVESYSYPITTQTGKVVAVSDFVWPSWFDQEAQGQQVDQMVICKSPFEVAPHSYAVLRNAPGSEQEVFAALPSTTWPDSIRISKNHVAARTARRKAR